PQHCNYHDHTGLHVESSSGGRGPQHPHLHRERIAADDPRAEVDLEQGRSGPREERAGEEGRRATHDGTLTGGRDEIQHHGPPLAQQERRSTADPKQGASAFANAKKKVRRSNVKSSQRDSTGRNDADLDVCQDILPSRVPVGGVVGSASALSGDNNYPGEEGVLERNDPGSSSSRSSSKESREKSATASPSTSREEEECCRSSRNNRSTFLSKCLQSATTSCTACKVAARQ
ncbi:unnamed protein product, partial [Amoebophrya sp. A120]